jgi:hypothetical protein
MKELENTPSEYMNCNGLRKFLGLETNSTIHSWVCRKQIPFTRVSKRLVLFEREKIIQWLAEKHLKNELDRRTSIGWNYNDQA